MAYPTAPPRFLPEWGFTDTVANFVGESAANSANVLYNPFAAVPSMHVAFALMIAVPAIIAGPHRVFKVLWAVYPLVVTFVVVVTANHYWLDAVLGALVAAVSAWPRPPRSPAPGPRPGRGAQPPRHGVRSGSAPSRAPRRTRPRRHDRAARCASSRATG